ncbi:MAG: alpha/beta hydrolase [Candidatus Woesearchaeota archaeon]
MIVVRILFVIGFLYAMLGFLLFFFQSSFLYFPTSHCDGPYTLINDSRVIISEGSSTVVVYYHGNAGNACHRFSTASYFGHATVIYVEYPGYGQDTRTTHRDTILADVHNIHTYVKQYDRVVVFGKSLGSAVASYHASLGGVDELILVAPFVSIGYVAQRQYPIFPVQWMLRQDYTTAQWLTSVQTPIHIFHAQYDRVIPSSYSEVLVAQLSNVSVTRTVIEGVGHNNIWDSEVFIKQIQDIVE